MSSYLLKKFIYYNNETYAYKVKPEFLKNKQLS